MSLIHAGGHLLLVSNWEHLVDQLMMLSHRAIITMHADKQGEELLGRFLLL